MSVDELINKYLSTHKLSHTEAQFLREHLSKQRIEHLATRPQAKGKLSKALFKLGNYLYATPEIRNEKQSALPVRTATSVGRESIDKFSGSIVSGGGINSTGRKR